MNGFRCTIEDRRRTGETKDGKKIELANVNNREKIDAPK